MLGAQHVRPWFERLPTTQLCSVKWQSILRYAAITFVVSLTLSGILLFRRPEGFLRTHTSHYFEFFWNQTSSHPIDDLINEAHIFHESRLQERSYDTVAAAHRYRARRGRHPPPGFDAWVNYALEHEAIVIESFFDRIYADLTPFWGLDPGTVAEQAATWEHVVRVRNGTANNTDNAGGRVPWLRLWTDLVQEAATHLPDVDMPINYMDESRLIVPWENVTELVSREQASRSLRAVQEVVTQYSGLDKVDAKMADGSAVPHKSEWLSHNYWDMARVACAPDSPSRDVPPIADLEEELPEFPKDVSPDYLYQGYVRNFTAAMDPCTQPHLRGLHGTFIEPLTISTSKEMIPLFGGCKLAVNNEILIPGAMYLTDNPMYSGGASHGPVWKEKTDGIIWRGVASGGRNKKENWAHFQRHRLIEMLNGTTVTGLEESSSQENSTRAMTFEMPPAEIYDFPRRRDGKVGAWLEGFANAGFTELLCFPHDSECAYVRPFMTEVEGIPMQDQYKYKFMPDVDGNSFSARFRALLVSTSMPIKSTIYAEWHDDRLVPWLHFTPMDNTFQDLYAILDYFTRDSKGDKAAQFIAEEGRLWSSQVLRREDMLLYVWRLLLEFARICDEKRDYLGYIDDLE
ncbi:glycosyltransferase family 90 protein [Xylariaceae sp. FL0016]|nr:glycosyltransferase family 90 protein [Xylariaceae sp. FL0016]